MSGIGKCRNWGDRVVYKKFKQTELSQPIFLLIESNSNRAYTLYNADIHLLDNLF